MKGDTRSQRGEHFGPLTLPPGATVDCWNLTMTINYTYTSEKETSRLKEGVFIHYHSRSLVLLTTQIETSTQINRVDTRVGPNYKRTPVEKSRETGSQRNRERDSSTYAVSIRRKGPPLYSSGSTSPYPLSVRDRVRGGRTLPGPVVENPE